jgi:hypothetical protein
MFTKLAEGEGYSSRPFSVVPVSLSLDRETAQLLIELAPTKKARSAFVGRLLHAEVARREERKRRRRAIAEEDKG